jgi:hypothetical protein
MEETVISNLLASPDSYSLPFSLYIERDGGNFISNFGNYHDTEAKNSLKLPMVTTKVTLLGNYHGNFPLFTLVLRTIIPEARVDGRLSRSGCPSTSIRQHTD